MSTVPTSTAVSSAISELLSSGRKVRFDPDSVRYVCHTSTIPLPLTVDEQNLLRPLGEGTVEVTHSIKYQPGYDPLVDYRCCKKHCMYSYAGGAEAEILRDNCPCGRISFPEFNPGDEEPVEKFLQPLCFLQVVKELRYQFGYTDVTSCESDSECCHNDKNSGSRSTRPKIDLSEVMFCQNAQSITDASYSRPMRDRVGVSGWDHVIKIDTYLDVLDQLYWFRKFVHRSTRNFLSYQHEKNSAFSFKTKLTQCLHTITGQMVQKILLFPCEMEGYSKTAKLTASLFEELVRDYFKEPGDKPSPENSIYLRMKEIKKIVKQSFTSMNPEVRFSVFDLVTQRYPGCNHSRFWGGVFHRLRRRIEGLESDYTLSPAWLYTMGGFSQTRNMGWLPTWVAEPARKVFRENLARDKVIIPKDELTLIFKLVMKRLYEEGLENHFLETTGRHTDDDFKEVINSLRIRLKPSASNNSTVSQGGRVEDARQLLSDAIRNEWRIPTRSFQTGEVTGYIKYGPELRANKPEYEGYIFWASLQILINSLSKRTNLPGLERIDLPGSETWEMDLWKMQVVHISEPGKERNLTKTSSLLSWVLTVPSKICQMTLAFCQDHRAGLILSAQDWMHQKRISAESYESGWMYDDRTRLRKDAVANGFQDWTESTDFICRLVGATALQAFMTYIAFPRWLSDITLKTVLQDYTVTEVLKVTYENNLPEKEVYSGKVSEGFMMSMPLTKTILHLMHDVNVGLVHEILKGKGLEMAPRPTEARLDRTWQQPGSINMLRDF